MTIELFTEGVTPDGDRTVPLWTRDPLMDDDYDGGVRFVGDFGLPWCYGGTSPVPADSVVRDIAERGADGAIRWSGAAPIMAGGGVDFSTATQRNCMIEIPASVASALWGNGQQFLICLYLKLPTEAEFWNTTANRYVLQWATSGVSWTAGGPELVSIAFQTAAAPVRQLIAYRGKGPTAVDICSITSNVTLAPHLGQVCQIAFWRSATHQRLSLRSAAGGLSQTALVAAATDNTQDFSALTGKLGIGPSWGATLSGQELLSRNMRVYRWFVEATGLSGRDPDAVADADWQRVLARAAFT